MPSCLVHTGDERHPVRGHGEAAAGPGRRGCGAAVSGAAAAAGVRCRPLVLAGELRWDPRGRIEARRRPPCGSWAWWPPRRRRPPGGGAARLSARRVARAAGAQKRSSPSPGRWRVFWAKLTTPDGRGSCGLTDYLGLPEAKSICWCAISSECSADSARPPPRMEADRERLRLGPHGDRHPGGGEICLTPDYAQRQGVCPSI